MSTPHQASRSSAELGQGSLAMRVSQKSSDFVSSSLPLNSTIDGLNTSTATLPAEDASVVRTPSLRSRYVAPVTPDTSAGPSFSPGQLAPETVQSTPTDVGPQAQADPIQPTVQDDVESQVSSSSRTRASNRTR